MTVGGLDTWHMDKCPQGLPMLENVRVGSTDTANIKKDTILEMTFNEMTFNHRSQGCHPMLEFVT
jgi:hypothetical protein